MQYYEWRSTVKGTRRGVRYKGMLTKLGGVKMVKQLLNSKTNAQRALKFDADPFGAEQLALDPRFRSLFRPTELERAKVA